MTSEYSSNLYHVTERRLDQFATKGDPGERFHNMAGPWDLATRVGLDGKWRYKLGKKRYFRLALEPSYIFHVRNSIADYFNLRLDADYGLTRRDRVGLRAGFIPDRFKKNYREDGIGGSGAFVPAKFFQVSPRIAYRRKWSKRWSTTLAYQLRLRRFAQRLENYDQDLHEIELCSGHSLHKRVVVEAGGALGLARSPDRPEAGGFDVDRSYQNIGGFVELELNLPRRFETGVNLQYRFRRYITDEPADAARYGRRDHRPGLGVYAQKGFGAHFLLSLSAAYLINITNRTDPTYESDELGYEELMVGLELVYKV